MISHHRQSEISFWLLLGIGAAVLIAAIGIVSAAGGQLAAAINQPACGCDGAVISKPLMVGGAAGLLLVGWVGIVVVRLFKQTRRFISSLKIVRNTPSYQVIRDNRAVAFTAGLLKPQTYVSTGLLARLTSAEQRAVVRHERFHQLRHDPLRIALTETTRQALAWLPGVSLLYHHWRVTRELAADASSSTANERQALGRSLVKLLEQPAMPSTISAFSATEERVKQLVHPTAAVRRRQWFVPIIAAAVVLVGAVGLATQSRSAEAQAFPQGFTCRLTPQCIEERIQQSSAPFQIVCSTISSNTRCFLVGK